MERILVIGSLNMDMVINAPYIPKVGETILGRNFHLNPGGKGANQAAAIAKLGGNVQMLGCVGKDDMGNSLVESLNKLDIDTSKIGRVANQASGIAVITVADNGKNTIVVDPGANNHCSPEFIESKKDIIESCDIIVLQMEIPMESIEYIIKLGKEFNKKIILNPAPANKIDESLYSSIDYLIPNETELEIITGLATNTVEEIKTAGKTLLNKGVKNLIITMGEKGALFMNGEEELLVPSVKVDAVDTTAAGDSFLASFVTAIIEGKEVEEALKFAAKVASIVVCRRGAIASIPTRDELEE